MRMRAKEAGVTIEQIIDGTTGCHIWFFIDVGKRQYFLPEREQEDGSVAFPLSNIDDLLLIPDDFYLLINRQQTGANLCTFHSFIFNEQQCHLFDEVTAQEVFEQGLFESIAQTEVNEFSTAISQTVSESAIFKKPARTSEVKSEKSAATRRLAFPLTKRAMIENYKKEWPTIERDIKDASTNGLDAAKASKRGWVEEQALLWARANNKFIIRNTDSAKLQVVMADFHRN